MIGDAASAVLLAAIDGEQLSPREIDFFQKEQPAGVTLFKRNIPRSFADLSKNSQQLQDLLGRRKKAIVAIDQEGGRVSRLPHPFPNLGPPLSIDSENKSQHLIFNYGFVVGSCLLGLGINVNFAPVCDVYSNPQNVAIGDRSFSDNEFEVAKRSREFLRGMQASRVIGCTKHFPGQGDAAEDTHLSGTRIDLPLENLWEREMEPFIRLLPDTHMIMVSHAIYSSIDKFPASLSVKIMEDLLRGKLEYDGVIVTDDMNMKALPQDEQGWVESLCQAIVSGADLVLVCQGLERCRLALKGIRQQATSSPAFRKRLENAAMRVDRLRSTLS